MKSYLKISKHCISLLLIGLLSLLLCQTNWGVALQEDLGLSTLFLLRGALPSPEQVVIISVDKASAEFLHYAEDPEKWSRSYYADILDKLNQYDPALIVFNIHFADQRDTKGDSQLAAAIAAHKNVLLTSYIKKFSVRTSPALNELAYERVIHPIPELENAAIGTAPFPIPRSLSTVKKFWTHKNTIGDSPTLPTAVFQCYLLKENYAAILQILKTINPALYKQLPTTFKALDKPLERFHDIQLALTKNGQSLQTIEQLIQSAYKTPDNQQLLKSWRSALHYTRSPYLNYYGNVAAIKTIPLSRLLSNDITSDMFKHKIILIGYSTDIEPEKYPGFYSVFSRNGEGNTSPVEIEATAIANLLDNTWVKTLPWFGHYSTILILSGLLLRIFRRHTYKVALCVSILICIVYLTAAYFIFISYHIWIPVFIIVVQTVLITLLESIFYLISVQRVSAHYLPHYVFNKNTQNPDNMDSYGELMLGVCMATDAGQYTALSENMNPVALNTLMNKYYGVMFPTVTNCNGLISDVVGDAVMALWAKPIADKQLRIDACNAALKMDTAIQHFNQAHLSKLPTRVGLHYGEMRLGNIGAAGHYEYRAVGDTVNTATRIEGLNKVLGTRILVSGSVIDGLNDFVSREIGQFLLKGKTQAITVFELLDKSNHIEPKLAPLHHAFSKALLLFQDREWSKAQKAFENLNKYYPNDGPTLFYVQYLQKNLAQLQDGQCDNSKKPIIEIRQITESWRYLNINAE
jgi:adenylate cyclase